MTIAGKTVVDYAGFQKVLLGVTIVVGLTRFALSVAGVANEVAVWFSMDAIWMFGIVYYPIQVHRREFGGYVTVLVLLVIQLTVISAIISSGIALAAVTGSENIFSEMSGAYDWGHWAHAGAHLALGPTVFAGVSWLPASVILLVTRALARIRS